MEPCRLRAACSCIVAAAAVAVKCSPASPTGWKAAPSAGRERGPGPLTLQAGEVAEGEAMTEVEWLACIINPNWMLKFLAGRASDRKLRLLGVACCRGVEHLLADHATVRAFRVAE